MKRNIIVIGASAGGFDAIRSLVSQLKPTLDASVFIVWHMAPTVHGILADVLNKEHGLEASQALDKEVIRQRHIYVAPPDRHITLEAGVIRVTRGPKENRFRPAIDPLFRSAAYTYGHQVIGVILSGALDDGSAGLWTIKQYGGLAIVQDPGDAKVSAMPENALRAVDVDFKVPIKEMGAVLNNLVAEIVVPERESIDPKLNDRTENEIKVAMEKSGLKHNIIEFGELTPFTCPECHGVLTSIVEGDRVRFRCHTGHAFSSDILLALLSERIEESLWSSIRSIQESVMLLTHLGDHFAEKNQTKLAALYFQKANESANRLKLVREAVFSHEQLRRRWSPAAGGLAGCG